MGGLCPSISCGSQLSGPAAVLAYCHVLTGHMPETGPVNGGFIDLGACHYEFRNSHSYDLLGQACLRVPIGYIVWHSQDWSCLVQAHAHVGPGMRIIIIMQTAQHELSSNSTCCVLL